MHKMQIHVVQIELKSSNILGVCFWIKTSIFQSLHPYYIYVQIRYITWKYFIDVWSFEGGVTAFDKKSNYVSISW